MFCKKCGTEFDGKFCPNCGEPVDSSPISQVEIKTNRNDKIDNEVSISKLPFYQSTWFIVLMLFCCCFPIGLFLMWKYKKFPTAVRIIITALFALAIFMCLISGNSTTKPTISESTKYDASPSDLLNESETDISLEETTVVDNRNAALTADTSVTEIITAAESDYQKLVDIISTGNASDLDLYNVSKAVKSNLGTYSVNVRQVKCDGIKDYTSAASLYIINMQMVAENVMKYIDKKNVKYLSSAQEEIANNQNYIFSTLRARMDFLTSSGFSEEEVMNIIGSGEETVPETN